MMKQLCTKWRIISIFFASVSILVSAGLRAQNRYFAVSLVNENDIPHLDLITNAKNAGCNAVLLTVQWGSIEGKLSRILKQENGANYNVWKQYDDQIARAKSLGMKVGINIAVSTDDDVVHSTTDRYGIDTGDGWKKEERILNVNYNGEEAVFQKYGGQIRPNVNVQFVMTSLAAQSTRDRIVSFTNKVIQRYKSLQNSNDLLYVNLIYTRTGEGEFEMGSTKYNYEQELDMYYSVTDYSKPIVMSYRQWLANKYRAIQTLNAIWGTSYSSFDLIIPKRPSNSTFAGADGHDWFLYRTSVLKEISNLFKDTVKGISPNIKVISHHGSVYDRLSRARGTFAFNEIGENLDGIKINDDNQNDHRFALDLIRTNMPGKMYINETAYSSTIDPVLEMARESYTHGANLVSVMFLDIALENPSAVAALQSFTNEWVKGKAVSKPVSAASASYTLSNMITVDGCATDRYNYSGDCDAYRNWRAAYDNSGGKPVSIFVVNDLKSTSLPVSLVSFNARKQEQFVHLEWNTSEESNSDFFEIQRSMDGKDWAGIGKTNSSGDSKILEHYTYTDKSPMGGENLYRLKMQDLDGTFAFSKIVSVKFEKTNSLVLFPNPVTNGIIQLQYSGTMPEVSLVDIGGRSVTASTETSGTGQLTVTTTSRLSPGLYILTANYGQEQIHQKVVVSE